MKTKKPVAIIDLDGVVCDFDSKFQTVSERLTGKVPMRIGDAYAFEDRYDISAEHVKDVFEAMDWSKIPIYKGAADAISKLKEHYTVLFCSAANIHLHGDRKKNLEDNGIHINDDDLILVGNDPKSLHYKNADLVIDDHARHIKEAMDEGVPNIFMVYHGYSCMRLSDFRGVTMADSLVAAVDYISDHSDPEVESTQYGQDTIQPSM